MYWLYFARDFYRAGNQATAAKREPLASDAPRAQIATIVVRNPKAEAVKPRKTQRKRAAAKRQQQYVVRSAPVESPAVPAPAPASPANPPLTHCLERLSTDGEHAFAVWDEENGFSEFSPNFERITGLSAEECAGHDWIHQIHHEQQYAVNEALLRAGAGHDGACLVEASPLREGAEARWLRMDIKAASTSNPNIMVLLCDLTEKKALEEALKETRSALEVSERSRSAFLSSMSHELRTPLNAIIGFSEMMRSAVFGELGNSIYKEYAKHIHESGGTLLTKINDLLDIASMDMGGMELEENEFSLAGMMNEAIEIHSHHAFSRQQVIHFDCPHAIELLGDRAKLMCAVSHLITNALRHSPNGADISVSVSVQADEGVILSVRDEGEGIAQAQLDIIREALAADVTYFKIESGGIGLGLSLTKELAARHGGRVMIDSMRHRGTVVSMILPTARVLRGMPQPRKRMQW